VSPRFTIWLLFVTSLALAQDRVLISKGFREQDVVQNFRFFKSTTIRSPDSAYQFFLCHPEQTQKQAKPFIGIVREPYWFLIELKNESEQHDFVLEIRHSHLRHIELYEIRNGKIKFKSTVGELYPFNHRPIQHRHFAFPVELGSGQSIGLLFYVDHENSLALSTVLWVSSRFYQNDYNFNLVAGIIIGFLIFCSFFSITAFFLLKKPIFGWYAVYLFFTSTYLFTDLGFAFQYVFPELKRFDGPFSIYAPLLMFVGLTKFSQEFLSLKQNLTHINRLLTILILTLLSLILVDIIFQERWRQFSFYILPIVFVLLLIGIVSLLLSGILSLRANKKMATFFLVSYAGLIFFIVFSLFGNAFGLVIYTIINPIYLGVLMEVAILSIALIGQYRDLQNDRLLLQQKLASQQKEMYENYIAGVERERNRIAGDLHDDIGSKLSHLQRILFPNKEDKQSQLMDEIIDDIRNISHDLAPTVAHLSGLLPLVEKLILKTRSESKIDVKLQTHDFKEVLSANQIIQVYRCLQEALNNIVKHSQATRVDLQLFGHENEVHVTVEDNGKGFDKSETTEGFGLSQMKIRAESLGGRIEINSHSGTGTLILLQIPTPKSE